MRLLLKLSFLLVSAPLFSKEAARRQAHATRVEEAPLIDGVVEEGIWSRAEVITGRRLDAGGFYSGNRASVGTTLNLRYGADFNTSITWSYNDVDLAEGSFVTNLAQRRVSYSFTPSVNVQSLIQYNDQRDVWSTNLRFSWLNTAGTGLFVVYNDTEGLGDLLVGPQSRSFIVKYTHQFDVLR